MSDTQDALWRKSAEYERIDRVLAPIVGSKALDALCARVYAQGRAYEANAQWAAVPRLNEERARADRLAAALRDAETTILTLAALENYHHDPNGASFEQCSVKICVDTRRVLAEARAALADVREPASDMGWDHPGQRAFLSGELPDVREPAGEG